MTARYLPREHGVVITCDVEVGVASDGSPITCPNKYRTANVVKKHNRAAATKEGWMRGEKPGRKRMDVCPDHAPAERALTAQWKKDKAERRAARDEARKLMFASKQEREKAKAERKAARAAKKLAATQQEASAAP